jgi:hypothetical protein
MVLILKNSREIVVNWLDGLTSREHPLPKHSVIAYIWGYESVPAYIQKDMSKLNAYGGLFR